MNLRKFLQLSRMQHFVVWSISKYLIATGGVLIFARDGLGMKTRVHRVSKNTTHHFPLYSPSYTRPSWIMTAVPRSGGFNTIHQTDITCQAGDNACATLKNQRSQKCVVTYMATTNLYQFCVPRVRS